MTAQLPTPGGDEGTWGSLLNEFLLVAHNTDGTIQTSAVSHANGITSSQVGNANGVASLNSSGQVPVGQLGTGIGSTSNYLRGDGIWATPSGSGGGISPPAGDLGGTSTSPTVISTHLSSPLPVSQGGTGAGTLSGVVVGNGTSAMTTIAAPAGTIVGTSDTQTLTNKSISGSQITSTVANATNAVSATSANALNSATTTVVVNGATAPSSGQVLTASSGTAASWQTPTSAPVSTVFGRAGAVVATSGDYTAAEVTSAADKSSGSIQTFTGNVSAPAIVATGLSGATQASRYVGATTSGAPGSGAFLVGDFVIDQTAKLWICTTAGSPGTWTKAGLALDTVAGDIQALGTQAAGSTGTAADAGHVHPTTGLVVQSGSTMNGYLAPKVTTLTFAASLTIDASQANAFELTLTGNVTSMTISNATAGELIRILLIQDSTGSRTVAWPSNFDWGSAGAPILSTLAGKTDMIVAHYSTTLSKWLASSALGY